jgi:hypothetical protein
MAALYRGPTKGYKLTDYDKLVLTLSIWGEESKSPSRLEASAVCWGLIDRYLLLRMRWLTEGWSFGKFIRNFSQPVKEAWADPNSTYCHNHPKECTADKIARRREIQSYLGYSLFDGLQRVKRDVPVAYSYAQQFQDGKLSNPFSEPVYDFAACTLTSAQAARGSRPGSGINIGGACYLRLSDLGKADRDLVVPGRVYSGLGAHFSVFGTLLTGLVGGIVAFLWSRKRG